MIIPSYHFFAFFLDVLLDKQSTDGHSHSVVDKFDALLPPNWFLSHALHPDTEYLRINTTQNIKDNVGHEIRINVVSGWIEE